MSRTWGSIRLLAVTAAAVVGPIGCAAPSCPEQESCITSHLFFADVADQSQAATDIGRAAWPTTTLWQATVEDVYFQEQYLDIQGTTFQDRWYPQRRFISRRSGVQLR